MYGLLINKILQNTEITRYGTAGDKEFIYQSGKYVKKGTPYHIHITQDKIEFYMIGAFHSSKSDVILRIKGRSNFGNYAFAKQFNLEREVYLTKRIVKPTEEDYLNGFMTRHFARRANDERAEIFEISEAYYELTTPFYRKIKEDWLIGGTQQEVKSYNENVLLRIKRLLGKIKIDPLQYWKPPTNTEEYVRSKLIKEYSKISG